MHQERFSSLLQCQQCRTLPPQSCTNPLLAKPKSTRPTSCCRCVGIVFVPLYGRSASLCLVFGLRTAVAAVSFVVVVVAFLPVVFLPTTALEVLASAVFVLNENVLGTMLCVVFCRLLLLPPPSLLPAPLSLSCSDVSCSSLCLPRMSSRFLPLAPLPPPPLVLPPLLVTTCCRLCGVTNSMLCVVLVVFCVLSSPVSVSVFVGVESLFLPSLPLLGEPSSSLLLVPPLPLLEGGGGAAALAVPGFLPGPPLLAPLIAVFFPIILAIVVSL
ncbi:hypothetical protein AX774_g800 [Zancudomyces culisetae]|uniref:Uncharacterized protein n=1 Tax=Zancudomyces culisetae TaxID=1213189 RepID=A0A1R1PXF1_ZANCU|nr:hypothetical protein AX774_g800 [Zancudomyces culisetae]|eukprot:OMH85651.1 hypothetical protein AX774_g800 [Zancudomyces culisetae]